MTGNNPPLVYVAGPYRADTEYRVMTNIRRAERVALAVWTIGGVAICPHKNSAFLGGANGLPDSVWLDGDIIIMSRCDAVITVPGWATSAGSLKEIAEATRLEKPIFNTCLQFAIWLHGNGAWGKKHLFAYATETDEDIASVPAW